MKRWWNILCFLILAVWAGEPKLTQQEAALLKNLEGQEPKAVAERLAQEAQRSPALCFTQGAMLVKAGEEAGACNAFLEAVKLMPEFDRARLNASKLLMKLGRYLEAVPHLTYLLEHLNQGAGELWFLLAQCHWESRAFVAAEAAARNAIALRPELREARLLLLQVLAAQPGRLTEAASLARLELDSRPQDARLWRCWASAELAAGRNREAMETLETARRFGAVDTLMLTTLLDLYLEQSLPVQATGLAQELDAKKLLPQEKLQTVVRFLQDCRCRKESAALLLNHPEEVILLARQRHLEGDSRGAEAALREALARNPLDGETVLTLGKLRQDAGDAVEAGDLFGRASLLKGFEYRGLIASSRLAVDCGDFATALAFAIKANGLQPSPELESFIRELRTCADHKPGT